MRTTLLKASLLCMGLLLSVAVVSAQGRFNSATSYESVTNAIAATSANSPSQIPAILISVIYAGDDGNKNWGWGYDDHKKYKGDGDNDWDDHHHRKDHDPTPEPSTLLSFGAAILIGGGVLYSRRLRATRK
jgi:hypothetical protein